MTDRTKQLRIFTALGLALMIQCASFAQTKPVSKTEPQTKQERKQPATQGAAKVPAKAETPKPLPPKFTLKMIEGEKLDQAFAGIPLVDLISAVEKSTSVKRGEFESTSDFNARKAAALSEKILGNYGLDDTFAVIRSVASGGKYPRGLSYTFNPDTSEVSIYVLPSSSTLNGIGAPDYQTNRRQGHGLDLFAFDIKTESQSSYQGSNAFGATVTVEKSIMSSSGIASTQVPFLNFKRDVMYSNAPFALQFKMENSKAARELPALRALIVFKLVEPFVHYDFVRKEPKRDSPTDISMQYKYLSSRILGIVYYSGLTREIFARLPDSIEAQEAMLEKQREERKKEAILEIAPGDLLDYDKKTCEELKTLAASYPNSTYAERIEAYMHKRWGLTVCQ